jgi:hypothetical protein
MSTAFKPFSFNVTFPLNENVKHLSNDLNIKETNDVKKLIPNLCSYTPVKCKKYFEACSGNNGNLIQFNYFELDNMCERFVIICEVE